MSEQQGGGVIDVWGYVKKLWPFKWIWLLVFLLVAGSGGAYAMTRPPQVEVTQSALITVPAVASEAEATQQAASLTSISDVLRRLATRTPVADAVLALHPEIGGIEQLQGRVTVTGSGLLIDIKAGGEDAEALSALVHDVAVSMEQEIPTATSANPPHLRASVVPVGDPMVESVGSGRTMLLAASLLVALIVATLAAELLATRRR